MSTFFCRAKALTAAYIPTAPCELRKEKKRLDYALQRHFSNKPSILVCLQVCLPDSADVPGDQGGAYLGRWRGSEKGD